jgi:hypothetical protein
VPRHRATAHAGNSGAILTVPFMMINSARTLHGETVSGIISAP